MDLKSNTSAGLLNSHEEFREPLREDFLSVEVAQFAIETTKNAFGLAGKPLLVVAA